MRAFGVAKDEEARGGDDDHGDSSARRVVSLKSGGAKAPAGEGLGEKRRREERSANGDGEENGAPKRGVRGRGAATYQSSVVAAVYEGPRRDPPKSDPTRLLKVCIFSGVISARSAIYQRTGADPIPLTSGAYARLQS